MKVIGIQEKAGKYEGRDYHNFILHCTKKADGNGSLGEVTELVKIKASDSSYIFDKVMTSSDWQNLIGKEIKYFCDKYGKVVDVRIVEPVKVGWLYVSWFS